MNLQHRINVLAQYIADNHNRLCQDGDELTKEEVIEHNAMYLLRTTLGIEQNINRMFELLDRQNKGEV